jgi:hypothetical protein
MMLPFGFVLCCSFLSSLSLRKTNKQITCCVLKYSNVQSTTTNSNGNDISLYHHLNCFPQKSDESRNTGGEQTENHEEYQHVPCTGYLVSFQRHNIQSFHITLPIFHILLLFPVVFWFAELFPILQFPIHESQGCHRLLFGVDRSKLHKQLQMKFKNALKTFLFDHCFYSIDEFFLFGKES